MFLILVFRLLVLRHRVAYSDRSVCHLLHCLLWPNGARCAFGVYGSRIGMLCWEFMQYHFRPPMPTPTSTPLANRGHNLTLKLLPNGGRQSKTLSWEILGNMGRLSICAGFGGLTHLNLAKVFSFELINQYSAEPYTVTNTWTNNFR